MTDLEQPTTTWSGRKDILTRFRSGTQHPRFTGSSAPVPVGHRFGMWEVLDPTFIRAKHLRIRCRCTACGMERDVDWNNLRTGKTNGCICRSNLHMNPYPELWMQRVGRRVSSARNRCRNPNNPQWANYGGRGITFDFTSTREAVEWIVANLGAPQGTRNEIDRIDNDRGYTPGNLRWATRSEQCRNTRRSKSTTS